MEFCEMPPSSWSSSTLASHQTILSSNRVKYVTSERKNRKKGDFKDGDSSPYAEQCLLSSSLLLQHLRRLLSLRFMTSLQDLIIFVASPKSMGFYPSPVHNFPSRSHCLGVARLQVGSTIPRLQHLLLLQLATTRNHSIIDKELVTGAYIIVIAIAASLFAEASC
ncbi:hypothetical protein ACLOJK_004674 [Asimina triloba]